MCSSNTCDMYMCRLRHINDPVLSSLQMEGIRLRFECFVTTNFFYTYVCGAGSKPGKLLHMYHVTPYCNTRIFTVANI
jgi:hypothetical protein